MNSRSAIICISLGLSALFGLAMRPLELHVRQISGGASMPVLGANTDSSGLGQGLSLGVLGGYRSLVANFAWLDMNSHWEAKELNATNARIRLSVSIDPRPAFFWLNGARVIANDMPAWFIAEEELRTGNLSKTSKAIRAQFAFKALALLDEGMIYHSANPEFLIEKAILYRRKLDDLESAAEMFLQASEMEDAPFLAGRSYAELLVSLGRPGEALDFLESWYPNLPSDRLDAMKPVVAERIRQLHLLVGD